MLGTNKTDKTSRLTSGAYSENLTNLKYRYEPISFTKKWPDIYLTKGQHVAFRLFSDVADLKVTDRVRDKKEQFVVAGAAKFTDAMGTHLECLIRQVQSEFHTEVQRKTLTGTQSNYDPIFEEWFAWKDYNVASISVMLDPIQAAKETFIRFIDAWKLEWIDYVMTVDFPDKVDKFDRFVFDWTEYEVLWIIPEPYQTLAGIKKSMINYVTT